MKLNISPYSKPVKLVILIALAGLFAYKFPDTLVLRNEPFPVKPSNYYVASVTDSRLQKCAIAKVMVKTTGGKLSPQNIDLQGGASLSVTKFIQNNLSKDESLQPVVIDIKDLRLTESPLDNNRVEGQIKINFSFGLQKEYGTDALVTYEGGMHYIRPADNMAEIEPQLRKTLVNSLVFFNKWIKTNTLSHIKLAKKIKISFKDYTELNEGDTIYYAVNRPLTWADFKSNYKPRGTYAAEVMPSIGYDQHSSVNDGIVYVDIAIKTFLPKSTCWVNSFSKDDYTLNHEQRHFDIVKIVAEQYKRKILSANLTPDNYEAFINMEYFDAYRSMNKMQKAYDEQTRHGRDQGAQFSWNDRIDKELQSVGIIKRNLP